MTRVVDPPRPRTAPRPEAPPQPQPLPPEREHGRHDSLLGIAARAARRSLAFVGYGLALFALWVIVSPLLPSQYAYHRGGSGSASATAKTSASVPARPSAAPARIPGWAWSLNKWLSTPGSARGARPASAPHKVPAWFWDWRTWRVQVQK